MHTERLSLALEQGIITLPETGRIAVVAPALNADLSGLPKDRVDVVTRQAAVHSAFQNMGYTTLTDIEGPLSAAIVFLPRAKAEARETLAKAAAATDGPLIVDGQKTDGVDSVLKELRKRATVGEVYAKAHGKIFAVTQAELTDWQAVDRPLVDGRFRTAPGVFSADGIDPASDHLARALPEKMKGHVVDLGAGWGFLSDAILAREGVTSLDLVEADHAALNCARQNISDPRASFHWDDALVWRPNTPADHVVTNPPFHQGRTADPGLGQAFIRAAAAMLAPRGTLWLVANRHLPYEKTLETAFRDVNTLGQTSSFKLYSATAPRTSRKG